MPKVDVETLDSVESEYNFDDRYIRHAFIRKVFAIVGVQLLVTMGIVAAFIYIDALEDFANKHKWLFWTAFGIDVGIYLILVCCEYIRRSFPINFVFLFVFTLVNGIMLGCCSVKLSTDSVLIAFGITVIVVVALTIFALQTRIDFTKWWGFLIAGIVILIILSIVAIFVRSRILMIVYCSIGVFIFSIYLIYDIQLMMGGNHRYAISPEDYIMAALQIYIDIIELFYFILSLVGIVND